MSCALRRAAFGGRVSAGASSVVIGCLLPRLCSRAGKTTLFDCVSRLTRPQAGRIELAGRDVTALHPHQVAGLGVARTFQHLGLVASLSVRDNVMLGAGGGA